MGYPVRTRLDDLLKVFNLYKVIKHQMTLDQEKNNDDGSFVAGKAVITVLLLTRRCKIIETQYINWLH